MRSVFVSSTGKGAGQSLLVWSLAWKSKILGLKTGFFKPYGISAETKERGSLDPDAILMRQVLGLEETADMLCPFVYPERALEKELDLDRASLLEKIRIQYGVVSRDKELMIIMGPGRIFFETSALGIPDMTLINLFQSPVLLIDRYQDASTSVYSILAVHSLLKERLISVVINRIALKEMSRIRHRIIPYLREKGVALWAGIPEDSLINSLTMREVKEILRGETAWGEEKEGNLVVDFTISSSYLAGPLGLFRRIPQKIILLGLDPRKSAGSEGSKFVTGILLTGGRRPGDIVVETAAEEGIPLIVIPGDAFTAMESLERAVVDPKWGDTLKMNRFVEFLEQETSIERFIKTLMEG